jgi:hypothetical protein
LADWKKGTPVVFAVTPLLTVPAQAWFFLHNSVDLLTAGKPVGGGDRMAW